jgi:hypothetical protein
MNWNKGVLRLARICQSNPANSFALGTVSQPELGGTNPLEGQASMAKSRDNKVGQYCGVTDAVSSGNSGNDVQLTLSGDRIRTYSRVMQYSVDRVQIYCEDKLGCARGVLSAFVFQAGIWVAAAIVWAATSFSALIDLHHRNPAKRLSG